MIDVDIEIINNSDIIKTLTSKKYNSKIDFIDYTYLIGLDLDTSYKLLNTLDLTFFNKEINSYDDSIIKYIKTFEHVCTLLSIKTDDFYNKFKHLSKAELALKKLILIAKLLNNDWKPNFKNQNEQKWFPYFDIRNGFVFYVSYCYHHWSVTSGGGVGGWLYVKNNKLSDFFGKQFIDIWKEYLLNRDNVCDFIDELKS